MCSEEEIEIWLNGKVKTRRHYQNLQDFLYGEFDLLANSSVSLEVNYKIVKKKSKFEEKIPTWTRGLSLWMKSKLRAGVHKYLSAALSNELLLRKFRLFRTKNWVRPRDILLTKIDSQFVWKALNTKKIKNRWQTSTRRLLRKPTATVTGKN